MVINLFDRPPIGYLNLFSLQSKCKQMEKKKRMFEKTVKIYKKKTN